MDCRSAADVIDGIDLDRAPDLRALAGHLATCDACRAGHPEVEHLIALAPQPGTHDEPAAIGRASARTTRLRDLRRVAAVALAAAILVTAGTMLLRSGPTERAGVRGSPGSIETAAAEAAFPAEDVPAATAAPTTHVRARRVTAQRLGDRTVVISSRTSSWRAEPPTRFALNLGS